MGSEHFRCFGCEPPIALHPHAHGQTDTSRGGMPCCLVRQCRRHADASVPAGVCRELKQGRSERLLLQHSRVLQTGRVATGSRSVWVYYLSVLKFQRHLQPLCKIACGTGSGMPSPLTTLQQLAQARVALVRFSSSTRLIVCPSEWGLGLSNRTSEVTCSEPLCLRGLNFMPVDVEKASPMRKIFSRCPKFWLTMFKDDVLLVLRTHIGLTS